VAFVNSARIMVLHVITPDTPAEAWDTLRALRAQPDGGFTHSIIRLAHSPAVLASFMARRAIENIAARCAADSTVLHAWSPAAAQRCLPVSATHRPLMINAETGADLRRLAAWARSGTLALVCQSEAMRSALIRAGAPGPRCAVIRPAVAASVPNSPDRRALVRRQLRLDERDVVFAALPPAARGSGTFIATWAALLLEKVRPDVRLIMPRGGCEAERAWRLTVSCRHEHVVRVAPPDLSPSDCLAACDLAVYLPPSFAPLDKLAAAMAAGCPIVASTVPAIKEILVNGDSAWLCRPNDPQDAARCMLRALENPEQSRGQAARARALAQTMFSLPRMRAGYRRVYRNLAARRPAVCCKQVETRPLPPP
jgi:glycosyltransferase involved in cell wall biosynthesis